MYRMLLFAVALFAPGTAWALMTVHPLESPSGEHKVEIRIGPTDQTNFRVFHKGKQVVSSWGLGFVLEGGEPIPSPLLDMKPNAKKEDFEKIRNYPKRSEGVRVPNPEPKQVRGSWKPVYGERNEIPDNYNEAVVEYIGFMKIIFRAYDEGIAFCYEFETKENETLKIERELTNFSFDGDPLCWAVYSAQGVYENVPISKVKPNCERPLLVQIPDGPAVSIGEARLVDFARMRLQPLVQKTTDGEKTVLQAHLAGKVEIKGTGKPYRSPWRFVMAADSPGKLLERNYMLLNLNDPCKIADTSWIKPGKVIREVTLTTAGGKACVDFAVDRGLQYIEYDAGWYGHEYDDKSDATTVTLDPKRNPNPESLNFPEVIEYANTKGIGVIVYVNQRALTKQLDDILPLYKKWGIRGIKFGFVHVGSQEWTTWLHNAIAKCADYQMMVDVHDEYRVTGWERTYPNLMTVEGIRGNEEMPPPEHNVVTALTRMLCGRGDYTPCWYTTRTKGSKAHQLALPVVIYSPWTFLYWYDRPNMYKGEPELDLWKELPTTWDDTRVLVDDLPNTVAVARRSGDIWYVGILNGGEKRSVKVSVTPLLNPGRKYTVTAYFDKDHDGDGKEIAIGSAETEAGSNSSEFDVVLRANGGGVIRIAPAVQ